MQTARRERAAISRSERGGRRRRRARAGTARRAREAAASAHCAGRPCTTRSPRRSRPWRHRSQHRGTPKSNKLALFFFCAARGEAVNRGRRRRPKHGVTECERRASARGRARGARFRAGGRSAARSDSRFARAAPLIGGGRSGESFIFSRARAPPPAARAIFGVREGSGTQDRCRGPWKVRARKSRRKGCASTFTGPQSENQEPLVVG